MSENRTHIDNKDQLVKVYGNNAYLLWATICKTQIHCMAKCLFL